MARPLADDLRQRVVRAVESGKTQLEVAQTFDLGLRTVGRYMSRWRENGQFARGKFGGHKKHLLAAHAEHVRRLVTAAPELTLAALCSRLAADGIKVSASALDRFLTASDFTYKKNPGRRRTTTPRRGRGAARVASRAKAPGTGQTGVH
jgi:putative transposase